MSQWCVDIGSLCPPKHAELAWEKFLGGKAKDGPRDIIDPKGERMSLHPTAEVQDSEFSDKFPKQKKTVYILMDNGVGHEIETAEELKTDEIFLHVINQNGVLKLFNLNKIISMEISGEKV